MLIAFNNIDFNGGNKSIQEGTLVKTEDKLILISIGIGQLELRDQPDVIFAISKQAPIFQVIKGLCAGDTYSLNNK